MSCPADTVVSSPLLAQLCITLCLVFCRSAVPTCRAIYAHVKDRRLLRATLVIA
jgi:hypothetical protein